MTVHETSGARRRPSNPKALVADDDPIMRRLMTEVLRAADYEVIEATDGTHAVEQARAHRPDVILVDLLMPKLSGNQVIKELRAVTTLRSVPIIMVSGVDHVDYWVQALVAGANDFIVKPVSPAELVARVEAQVHAASTKPDRPAVPLDSWRRSVVRDQAFGVVFQPIVDMASGHVLAQELLARFHDGTKPVEAFKAEGETEARTELELAVLALAAEEGTKLQPGVDIHLNVSPSAARDPRLPVILDRIDRPFVLEITENEIFSAADAQALRSKLPRGARIATDDVGVGYASLSQILDVRPDILKIDFALIAWVDEDPARQALIAGLVRFGAATGCALIAEGVERAAERDTLLSLGVNIGQGFMFGRPDAWPPPVPARVWAGSNGPRS